MSLAYGLVRARYVLYGEDGPDADDLPDKSRGGGEVDLVPVSTFPLHDSIEDRGVVTIPVYGLEIADGVLLDREGRDGVKLIAAVDGTPVRWEATVRLRDETGAPLLTISHLIDAWPADGPVFLHQLPAA